MATEQYNLKQQLHEFRHKIIDTVLIAACIFGLIALSGSLIRFLKFGWFNVFYIHIGAYIAIAITTLLRKKVTLNLKSLILLMLMFMIGAAGIISRGIMGSSFIWFIAGGITAIFLLGKRFAFAYISLGILIMIFTGYLVYKGLIIYSFDINGYVTSPNIWGLEVFTTTLISALLYSSTTKINSFFYNLLENVIQSKKNIRHLIDNITHSVIVYDQDLNIIEANSTFSKILKKPLSDIINKKISDFHFVDPIDFSSINVTQAKPVLNRSFYNDNHEIINFEISQSSLFYKGQKVVLAVLKDITQQKRQEREKIELIMQTEEKERSLFAKEIHDGVGPILSTSKMYLDILKENKLNDEGEFALAKVKESIDDALQSLKEISNKISPHILKNFGPSSAIQNFMDKHKKGYPFNFHLNTNFNQRLSENIEILLYRISIELINNTSKYAQANLVTINILAKNDQLFYAFEHDGKGFDFEKTKNQKKGMGLFNIEQRVHALDGKFNIYTATNSNLQITIVFKNVFKTHE